MFLAGAGAAAALMACGESGRGRVNGRRIVVANHPLYIDASTNRAFTDETGIAVEYHEEVTDDGRWFEAVQGRLDQDQSIDRDVVIVSDFVAHRLRQRASLSDTEPVTWAMGMIGIAYDAKAVDGEITRVVDLFQPPLHGRVALPDDMRMSLGMALLADGVDPATASVAATGETAGRLANSVRIGQVLPIDGRLPLDRLLAGEADAAVVRASDTVGLDAAHPDIRFVVPREGGILVRDVAAVMADAADAEGGASYLAFVSEPARAADRFRIVPAVWERGPIDEVLRRDAPAVFDDPRRNPPDEVRSRLRPFRLLSEDEESRFEALFDEVVDAAMR